MKKSIPTRLKTTKGQVDPVMKLLGIRVVREGRGSAVFTMKTSKEHLNQIKSIHGGILCVLSDAAMGYAFATLLAKGQVGVTVEFKINFLQAVFGSDQLTATAKVLSHSKSLCYAECEVRNGSSQLIAKAAATFKFLRSKYGDREQRSY